jgi:hypothetical protein
MGKPPLFRTLKECLQFICHGELGTYGYTCTLELSPQGGPTWRVSAKTTMEVAIGHMELFKRNHMKKGTRGQRRQEEDEKKSLRRITLKDLLFFWSPILFPSSDQGVL